MTSSICGGGVAITREQMDNLPPPRPLGGKDFLVVAGNRITAAPPSARFTTRADGTFVTRLPPGTWCFFEAGRRPSETNVQGAEPVAPPTRGPRASSGIDPGCVEDQKRRCDLVLPVKSDIKRAEISFAEPCPQVWNQPCYRGPMPP